MSLERRSFVLGFFTDWMYVLKLFLYFKQGKKNILPVPLELYLTTVNDGILSCRIFDTTEEKD